MADTSALSLESPVPDSPHAALLCSVFCPPEPMVSGYKQHFVSWAFKRVAVSHAISLWLTKTPLLYTARCYVCVFPGSGTVGWGAWLGGLEPTLLRGNPLAAEISLRHFSYHLQEPSQSSSTSSHSPPVTLW